MCRKKEEKRMVEKKMIRYVTKRVGVSGENSADRVKWKWGLLSKERVIFLSIL